MAWFAFDVDAYDADTMHLTPAEDGVYMRLLRFYYKTRLPLPDDDKALAGIARVPLSDWLTMAGIVRAFFTPCDGKLLHKRCDCELAREDALARKRSEHATRASHARASYIRKLASPRYLADVSETSRRHLKAISNDLPDQTRPDSKKDALQ